MSNDPLFANNPTKPAPADTAAVELIRSKVERAYGSEPDAQSELTEAKRERTPSKHQLFMQELARAGKSLAEIQVAWHDYYTGLPDEEKREVWEEFYAANQHTPYQKLFQKQQPVASRMRLEPLSATPESSVVQGNQYGQATASIGAVSSPIGTPIANNSGTAETARTRSSNKVSRVSHKASKVIRKTKLGRQVADSQPAETTRQIKRKIQNKVSADGQLNARHHLQSLLFGLGMGAIVLVVLLFGFFNEIVLARVIQPSRNVGNIPVIASNITAEQAAKPSLMVPSINAQLPIDFNLGSTAEPDVQKSLENGVVHYPNTVLPGQNGNGAYFGHSSQNIFNRGNYKFAFVDLHLVKTGDIFYVTYQGKVYAYQIFAREIVPPSRIDVLTDTKGEQATAILVTCDPPGFNINRLVVWGKQISPSPSLNQVATPRITDTPMQISGNGPTLWMRMWQSIQFWN